MEGNSKDKNDINGGLILDPSTELKFKGPFTDVVTVNLTIQNPTNKKVAFKIKTTAPKKYCVKPNSGVLESNALMKVSVLLQPFNYDPNEKGKHKFMVQYLYLTDEESLMSSNDIINAWKDFSQDRLLDIKLKCTFESNEGDSNVTNDQTSRQVPINNLDNKQARPSARSSEASFVTTLSLNNTNSTLHETTSDHMVDSENILVGSASPNKDQLDNIINENKALRHENDKLKIDNVKLKEETNQLKKQLLRDTSSSTSKSSLTQQQKQPIDLAQLLNNRLIWIIVALIAMNLYLMLFK